MSSEQNFDHAPAVLPVLALRGLVLFPEMVLHFDVGRKKSILALNAAMNENQTIFLVPQLDLGEDDPAMDHLSQVGVVATVRQVVRQTGDGIRILVQGKYRAKIDTVLQNDPFPIAEISELPDKEAPITLHTKALIRSVREKFEQYLEFAPRMAPDVVIGVQSTNDPGKLADYIAANVLQDYDGKQESCVIYILYGVWENF